MSRPVSRTAGQIAGATLAGAVIGLAGGAAIAAGLPSLPIWLGAALGAIEMGAISGWADAVRVPGRPQPVWVRILASSMLAGVIGWAIDLALPEWSSVGFGAAVGAGAGAIGGRWRKIVIGVLIGALVGLGAVPEPSLGPDPRRFDVAAPARGGISRLSRGTSIQALED